MLRTYRGELDRLGRWDRDRERRYAAERVANEPDAWDGRPVYAYGFEDLTAAQWALVEALSGRADVTVSLPYEPGGWRSLFWNERPDAFAAGGGKYRGAAGRFSHVRTTGDCACRALAVRGCSRRAAGTGGRGAVPRRGRFPRGVGARGRRDPQLVRGETDPAAIAIVAPSLERWRAPLETTFAALDIPYAIEGRLRLGQTPFGSALLSLLRFAWLGGGRHDLYAFMRSPYSGLRRDHVDFLEGRLRGRAIRTPERVEQETLKLRGQPLPFLDALHGGESSLDAVGKLAASMLTAAHGLGGPPVSDSARLT